MIPMRIRIGGGEQFDIWTDRVTVDGVRFQSAFLLKGPAKFHPP